MVVADSHTRPVDSDRRSRLGRINTLTAEQAGLIALMRLSSKCVEGLGTFLRGTRPRPSVILRGKSLAGTSAFGTVGPRRRRLGLRSSSAASLSRGSREQARAERPLH